MTVWPPGTIWGTYLRFENGSYIEHVWFGFSTVEWRAGEWWDPYIMAFVPPGDAFPVWTKVPAANAKYPVHIKTVGAMPNSGTISSMMENATHAFVPQEFSVVLENRANGIFVNLRKENGYITGLPKYVTLYVDNFSPDVGVSVSPPYDEGPRSCNYTVTLTSLAENMENLDDLAPSSFSYELYASDNLGWGLEFADNLLDNIRPGHSKTTTLTVTIPENAEFGIKDNVVVTAISRTDPWVGDSASFPAFVPNFITGWNLVGFTAVGEGDTPHNIFGLDYYDNYYLYYWNAPSGPYSMQDPYQPLNDNTGYWVWVNQDMLVETSGTPQTSENIHLVAGWNLVGFPVVDANTTPDNIFAPLNYYDNYIIYYWNEPGGPYGLQGSNTVLKDNTGYLVWIDRDWTVTVP